MNAHKFVFLIVAILIPSQVIDAAEAVPIVSSEVVPNARQPQAAVDERGTIYVTFGAEDSIYCCRSMDRGEKFSEAIVIGKIPDLSLGMRRGPRIVADSKSVVVSAISHKTGNLSAWHSSDMGKTWQGPVLVNDSPKSAREGLHGMAISPNGDIYCAWLDLRNDGTQIFGALSVDGGKTWSENREIYRSPSGTVCECCHPSVAYDSEGHLHVMWRNSLAGFRDMYIAQSNDGGKTFNKATKLGAGSWKLNACPMDGGWLAAAGSGDVTTVWRRDKQIVETTFSQPGEKVLGNGEQPWMTATDDGPYIVWLSRRNGNLWLSKPDSPRLITLTNHAIDPVVASPIVGDGPVVVVWETGQGKTTTVMAMVVDK